MNRTLSFVLSLAGALSGPAAAQMTSPGAAAEHAVSMPVAPAPVPMILLGHIDQLNDMRNLIPQLNPTPDRFKSVAAPLLAQGPVMVFHTPQAATMLSLRGPMVGWTPTDARRGLATASLPPALHDPLWAHLAEATRTQDYSSAHSFLEKIFDSANFAPGSVSASPERAADPRTGVVSDQDLSRRIEQARNLTLPWETNKEIDEYYASVGHRLQPAQLRRLLSSLKDFPVPADDAYRSYKEYNTRQTAYHRIASAYFKAAPGWLTPPYAIEIAAGSSQPYLTNELIELYDNGYKTILSRQDVLLLAAGLKEFEVAAGDPWFSSKDHRSRAKTARRILQ
jgi:hypothetical protein